MGLRISHGFFGTERNTHMNLSIVDWHSLPFSGNISWEDLADKLKMIFYNGAIALEVGNTRFEHIAKPDEFLELAVERAERIGNL